MTLEKPYCLLMQSVGATLTLGDLLCSLEPFDWCSVFLRKICNKKSYPRYWTPVCCSVKTWTTHYHKKSALSHTVQTHTSVSKDSKVNRVNHCSWSVLSYNSSIFNWTVTSSLVFGRSLMTILSQAPPGGGILKLRNPDLPQKISAFFIPYW